MPETAPRGSARHIVFIILLLAGGVGGYLLFSSIANRQASIEFFNAYRALALNIVLVAAALAAGRILGLFMKPTQEEKWAPAILAVSYLLAGFGLWRGLHAFSIPQPLLAQAGVVCLAGAVAWSLSYLAVYAQRRGFGGVFSGLFFWLVNTRALFLLIVIVAAAYAVLIRPNFIGANTYSVLLEWIFIILTGVIILGITRFRISRSFTATTPAPAGNWQRHHQLIEAKTDQDYTQWRNVEQHFIENGNSVMLIYHLVSLLAQNGSDENKTAQALAPLIAYPIPAKSDSRRPGRLEREELLKKAVTGMQAVVQPSRLTRYTLPPSELPEAMAEIEVSKTISGLVADFIASGSRSRLLVRLSRMFAERGSRPDDIEAILAPLLAFSENQTNGRHERERLWQETVSRAAFYIPNLSLKE